MIRNLLSILALTSLVSVNAQSSRTAKNAITQIPTVNIGTPISNKSNAAVTLTLNPLTGTNVTVYTAGTDTQTPGCDPDAGYVFGSNCYGDLEKAQYFPASSYSAITQASVTSVEVILFKDSTMGTGGGSNVPVSINIYAGTSATVAPGALLGTATASMSDILAAYNGSSPFFAYTFTFATAPSLTGGFYASLTLPTTAGDTAVVANETAAVNGAWEKWSDNSWKNVQQAWGGLKVNLAIFPILEGNQSTVGISKSALKGNLKILPNPSNGLVNVNVNMSNAENISLTVINALGQQVLSNNYENVTMQSLPLDLSHQPNGVYFITVSNGKDKMVQKLIVNK